jgi:hypothetical protein
MITVIKEMRGHARMAGRWRRNSCFLPQATWIRGWTTMKRQHTEEEQRKEENTEEI